MVRASNSCGKKFVVGYIDQIRTGGRSEDVSEIAWFRPTMDSATAYCGNIEWLTD
jgi:hypothetical protein